MRREDILQYENKIVFLKLKSSGYHYTCKILKINKSTIDVIDKYNLKKTFSIDDISMIEEINPQMLKKKIEGGEKSE